MEAQDEHEAASECLMTAIDLEASHPIVPLTVIPRLLWAYQKFAVIQQPKTTRILKKWFLVVILLSTVNRITKSDERDTGVRFVYYEYESRQNWTTRSPVTNESTLWQNLRNKPAISYTFSWKSYKELGKCVAVARARDLYCPVTQTWRWLHRAITSMTSKCPISAQMGKVLTSCVRELFSL